ncbi:putative beta-glucosidase 41-like [Capsicum annuum]|nr:putative beta-glucosidase 41-like [Capsicum annuum]KAF3670473.1 putative beta-glucosidase 41-like [Capsicum annuum]
MSVTTSLALTPRGAASHFDIGRDCLNSLTISRVLESSSNASMGILKLFPHDVYCLLDPRSTFFYVTLYVAVYLDCGPESLSVPFSVSTQIRDTMIVRRVYRRCVVFVGGRRTLVDLIEFGMIDFDVDLRMDWLHSCYAFLDCRTHRVMFNFPNKPFIIWEGGFLVPNRRAKVDDLWVIQRFMIRHRDVKSDVVMAVNDGEGGGLFDVSPMQKVVAEFDDWEMVGGEEEIMSVIASIACDPNVWNAVMQNLALQEFLDSSKTSASFPDSDHKIDEFVAAVDSFSQSSQKSVSSKSEAEESKFGNSFIDFLQNITRIVTQTMVDMMNSLSDFFNNLFEGNKVFFNTDESAKLGIVETTLGESFMGLAVMVMMVIVSKYSQS